MSKKAEIKVTGLNELRKGLKAVDPRFGPEFKQANYDIVNDLIVPGAQQKAAGTFSRSGGKVAKPGHLVVDSIRALKQESRAMVALGSAKVPWAAGYEFGSLGGRYRNQFAAWQGNSHGAGYFLWPTITENKPEIFARYTELLNKIASQPFPN